MTCQRQTRNYRSLISETRLASLAILVAIALPPAFYGQNDTSGPPTEACSRDRKYCVRMIETPHHPDECTLRVSANGRTIAEFPTFGYLLGVFFSPNNAYVAINNRRANAGDYLWVISLKNGQAIKMPDDVAEDTGKREAGKIVGDHWSDQAMPEIVALCPACTRDDLGHPFLFSTGWKNSSELQVVEEFEFSKGWIAVHNLCRITGARLSVTENKIVKQSRPSEFVRRAWTWSSFHSE
jgi:hypothetical protein